MTDMRKPLNALLFCLNTLFATPVLSSTPYFFDLNLSMDYVFPPNEHKVISNIFRWTIHAECTILESDEKSSIFFKILRKTGIINQITLEKGESLRINVHPNDTFEIIAVPGASVELTNEGETTI